MGAREYDPAIGRFISVDPVIDPADPQQLHGYAYANNSPVTFSDPGELLLDSVGGGGDYTKTKQAVGCHWYGSCSTKDKFSDFVRGVMDGQRN